MPANLTDRPVLLTGASGGIGVALTEHLLAAGMHNLALQYRTSPERLVEVVRRHDLDPARHCFRADLSQEVDVGGLREHVEDNLGTVWGIVNLAGVTSNSMSWKLSLDDFQHTITNNLTSTFLTCREFIPMMREAQGGRIINISSVVAFSGVAGASHYGAAKAGVVGFTKSIARELAPRHITANVLALGYFNYGMLHTVPEAMREEIRRQVPVERFGTAPEIGATAMHLLSDEAAYTTGQVLHINGGMYG